jgi:integrase
MAQQGQVFPLAGQGRDGMRWADRYRVGGRGSRRAQRGASPPSRRPPRALERVLEQRRREQGPLESPTLAEFVDLYLAQHDGEPETVEKLRWLLAKAVRVFGERRLSPAPLIGDRGLADDDPSGAPLRSNAGPPPGACPRGQLGTARRHPAKLGVENPQRRYTEKRPFDSWEELYTLAGRLGPRYGPMVLFAAATGLRPGEWLALEHRDIDREAQVVYVRRTLRNGRIKTPKTKASVRAVPLQKIALAALDELTPTRHCPLVFPSVHSDLVPVRRASCRTRSSALRAPRLGQVAAQPSRPRR